MPADPGEALPRQKTPVSVDENVRAMSVVAREAREATGLTQSHLQELNLGVDRPTDKRRIELGHIDLLRKSFRVLRDARLHEALRRQPFDLHLPQPVLSDQALDERDVLAQLLAHRPHVEISTRHQTQSNRRATNSNRLVAHEHFELGGNTSLEDHLLHPAPKHVNVILTAAQDVAQDVAPLLQLL
jgi:hypothetical protein